MQCKFEIPKVEGLDDGVVTVGRELLLHCTEFPSNFNIEKTMIKDSNALYIFRILSVERRDLNSADIKWTSYRPGQHNFPQMILTDGSQDINLGPLQYEVQSVQSQTEPRKEPYGPVGPLSLPIPASIWIFIAIVCAVIAAAITVGIHKAQLKRQWLKDRQKYQVRISPLMQLYVDLRRLERKIEISKIDHSNVLLHLFEEYLIRKFDWPIPLMRRKQVARKIKKELKNDKTLAKQITELYRNLYNNSKHVKFADQADLHQLQKDILILIERLEKESKHELA